MEKGTHIKSLYAGILFMLLLLSAKFFSKLTFSKYSFRNTIRLSDGMDPHLSVLNSIQIVCEGYQHLTKVAASKESDNCSSEQS